MNRRVKPPRIAEWILKTSSDRTIKHSLMGDLEENFTLLSEEKGRFYAGLWYRYQVLKSLPSSLRESFLWRLSMFSNYLKISFRNIIKNRAISFINVSGLAIGITCCSLILLYVQDELSYDSYHEKADSIYRLSAEIVGNSRFAYVPGAWPTKIQSDFPEVINSVRFFIYRSEIIVDYEAGNRRFYERNFYWADSTVLDIFSWPLTVGDKSTALSRPNTIVISEDMANKYFGDENPIGEIISYVNGEDVHALEITGIMKNVPRQSHFRPEFLASLSTLDTAWWVTNRNLMGSWEYFFFRTYLQLEKGSSYKELEAQFPALIKENTPQNLGEFIPFLQPLKDIYLHSNIRGDFPGGNIAYVYIFSSIAFFILLIACINFMNLATARSIKRAKEVGLRKVLGSERKQLKAQFFGESLFMAFLGMAVAFVFIKLLIPWFSDLTGKALSIDYPENLTLISGIIVLTILVGLISGIYPAIYLSSFNPVNVLKGSFSLSMRGESFRKTLVVFQFVISCSLIMCTGVVSNQLSFMRDQNPGYDREHIMTIPMRGQGIQTRYEVWRDRILADPGVLNVSAASHIMQTGTHGGEFRFSNPGGLNEIRRWAVLNVDQRFPSTFGLELVSGRDFSEQIVSDTSAFIINESAVRALGLTNEEALGTIIDYDEWNLQGKIVGVAKDFHYRSMHSFIRPLLLSVDKRFVRFLSIKIQGNNFDNTMAFLQNTWETFAPTTPFEYSFQDENFAFMYRTEAKLETLFRYFALLAIFIACLGLFGLASFVVEQKTKEIGVRKVLGSSIANIFSLIAKPFIKMGIAANLISAPIAYWIMSQWLQGFAYPAGFGAGILIATAAATFLIVIMAIGMQVIKAGLANPITSLRYE